MSTPSTNIRVFVQWTEQTVFAGEDIECLITFRNVAVSSAPSRTLPHLSGANGFASGGDRQRKVPPSQLKNSSASGTRPGQPSKGHRATLSLNMPTGSIRSQTGPGSWNGGRPKVSVEGSTHKRSVSIISLGASEGAAADAVSHGNLPEGPRRMLRGHGRSASLQIVPRRSGVSGGPTSGNCDYHVIMGLRTNALQHRWVSDPQHSPHHFHFLRSL
jgi:hypothetical protein